MGYPSPGQEIQEEEIGWVQRREVLSSDTLSLRHSSQGRSQNPCKNNAEQSPAHEDKEAIDLSFKVWVHVCSASSHFATRWAPLSLEFSWQEYWEWVAISLWDLPDPGIKLVISCVSALAGGWTETAGAITMQKQSIIKQRGVNTLKRHIFWKNKRGFIGLKRWIRLGFSGAGKEKDSLGRDNNMSQRRKTLQPSTHTHKRCDIWGVTRIIQLFSLWYRIMKGRLERQTRADHQESPQLSSFIAGTALYLWGARNSSTRKAWGQGVPIPRGMVCFLHLRPRTLTRGGCWESNVLYSPINLPR